MRRSFVIALGAAATFAPAAQAGVAQAGVPQDWSHRFVVFSPPGPAPDRSNRTAYARWSKIIGSARFDIQAKEFRARAEIGRRLALRAPAPTNFASATVAAKPPKIKRDWSMTTVSVGTTINGVDRYPAKFSFDSGITPFCDSDADPDFVVYATGTGSTAEPDIVAFDNLYKAPTCAGATPLYYYRYKVGGRAIGSPILSIDGKQIAVVSVTAAGVARLTLLKWTKDPTNIVNLGVTQIGNYRNCVAPCMTRVVLNGNPNASGAAIFYDYESDTAYIGDDDGRLHKIINVFLAGTPTEVTSGWPLQIDTGGNPLTGAVFDPVTGNVIVGTTTQVVRVPASGGVANIIRSAAVSSACGFRSPPLLDVTVGRLYFTLADYNGTGAPGTCGAATGGPALIEYSATFANGAGHLAVAQMPNGTARNVQIAAPEGSFDNDYYDSTPGSPSGKYYACVQAPNPKLAQFTISNNLLTSAILGPDLATATTGSPQPSCSALIEYFDGASDRIFPGVYTGVATTAGTYICGAATTAAGGVASSVRRGCITSFNITPPLAFSPSVTPQAVLDIPGGGPSGVVIDNRAAGGGSQLYFRTLLPQTCVGNGTDGGGTGYCGVQASQNGLN